MDTAAECSSITINAPAANNGITIAGSNNLTVSGAITMNVPSAGVITSTIAVGTGTLNAGSIAIPGSGTAGRFCTVSVSTGTINVSGAITFSGTAAQARLTFTGAGTLNIGGNLGSGGTFTASTGTVNGNGSAAQTVAGYTYNTLKSNNPAGLTLLANATITTLTIGDITANSIFNDGGRTITLGAGSVLNMSNAGTYNLGSATVGTTWRAWGTINMASGTTVGYVSGVAQTVSATPTYQNLTLSGAGAKTVSSMTVQGNFISSGGTITLTAVRTISLGGDYVSSSALSFANRLILNLNGTGAQTVTNTITPLTLNSLTVNKASGTATLAVNITTTTTLTVTAGTLDLSSYTAARTAAGGTLTVSNGATLKIGGTNTMPANYTTHTFGATSTIEYSGTNQSVSNENYAGHLNLSGSGIKTLQAGTTTISGNLTLSGTVTTATVVGLSIGSNLNIGDGATFTAAGFNLSVTGKTNIGWGTSGNLVISAAAGAKTFTGLVTIYANGDWNNSGNSAITFRGGITNSGTFTAGTGVQTFDTNAQALDGTFSIPSVTVTGVTLTNNGTLTVATALDGTGGLTNAATRTLNIGFAGPPGIATLTADAVGNTVNYNFAGAQTVFATSYYALTLSGSGAKTTTGVTVSGILSMEGTATTAGTTPTYGAWATLQYQGTATQTTGIELPATFGGSGIIIDNPNGVNLGSSVIITNNLTLTSGTFAVGANTLTLNGSPIIGIPSNLSTTSSSSLVFGGSSMGVNIPGSVTALNNLTINNANGVTLESSPTINGVLTLTSGKITADSNTITISASGSVSGGSSSSYVYGNLRKNVATGATTRTFEVGATNYNPVTVAFGNVGTAGYLTVKATTGQHPNIGSSMLNSNKDVNVYWSLTNSGIVFDNYNATFTFVSGDILGGADTANFIVGKYNSGWTYPTVGVKTPTTTQATGITSFSDFVMGEPAAAAPTVNTDSATLVEETTATLDGTLINDGGEGCEYHFEYDTDTGEPYSFSTPWTGNITSGENFSANIAGLDKGTKYYFRAQSRNSGGTISGTELTLLTKPDAPVDASASTVSGTKIYLGWTKGEGAQKTAVVRKIGDFPADRNDGTLIYFNTGTSIVDSDLSPATTYYYRLWSQVSGSEQWSDGYMDATGTTGDSFFSSSSRIVGGETSPIDKAVVLAPFLILSLLIAGIIAAGLFRLRKHIFTSIGNLKTRKRYLAVFLVLSLLITSMLIPCSQPLADTSTEPRAAIIDQISAFEPDPEFVSKAAAMLESAGFKVDVWQGQAVTVDFYRELPRYGYKLIVFRTHMSFYYLGKDTSLIKGTALFSGETYSTNKHISEQLNDTVIKANITVDSPTVFAINSKFITETMEGRFDGTVILMMGCISYYLDDMANAFIQKGASTYVGWDGKVILEHLNRVIVDLIDNLFINQMSIEMAVMQTMATIGPDPYCDASLRYYRLD
ncbi:MAG: hypothetical protein A2Z15_08415 [Chloroflexi bacterium RBG_16_50_11]|nr:MAG: hypothetical protein A2Z15_08415 [Chloroflexi bacterium RBG_16_50_11]